MLIILYDTSHLLSDRFVLIDFLMYTHVKLSQRKKKVENKKKVLTGPHQVPE